MDQEEPERYIDDQRTPTPEYLADEVERAEAESLGLGSQATHSAVYGGTRSAVEEPEFYKQGFEAVKQLTTLSAGAIVLIGTFIQNIFPSNLQTGELTTGPSIKWLIASSFVFLGLSLMTSALSMFVYAGGRRFLPLTKFMSPDVVREIGDLSAQPPELPDPPSFVLDLGQPPHGEWSLSDELLKELRPQERDAREKYFNQLTPEQRAEYEQYRRDQEDFDRWIAKNAKLEDALPNARLKRYKFVTFFGVIPSFSTFIVGLFCFGSAVLINLL
jgi:hypothetical protein